MNVLKVENFLSLYIFADFTRKRISLKEAGLLSTKKRLNFYICVHAAE